MSKGGLRSRVRISIGLSVAIPLLAASYLVLKNKCALLALFLYTIAANSYIPFPHEPVVIHYGKISRPLTVSAVCASANCISSVLDIVVLGTLFAHKSAVEFRKRNRVYRIAEYYFNLTPFWTMAFAALTPVPFYPFRVLGVASGYARWRYVLSTFVGRAPRYFILAWIGNAYRIPLRYIVLLFVVMIVPPVIKIARGGLPSLGGRE